MEPEARANDALASRYFALRGLESVANNIAGEALTLSYFAEYSAASLGAIDASRAAAKAREVYDNAPGPRGSAQLAGAAFGVWAGLATAMAIYGPPGDNGWGYVGLALMVGAGAHAAVSGSEGAPRVLKWIDAHEAEKAAAALDAKARAAFERAEQRPLSELGTFDGIDGAKLEARVKTTLTIISSIARAGDNRDRPVADWLQAHTTVMLERPMHRPGARDLEKLDLSTSGVYGKATVAEIMSAAFVGDVTLRTALLAADLSRRVVETLGAEVAQSVAEVNSPSPGSRIDSAKALAAGSTRAAVGIPSGDISR